MMSDEVFAKFLYYVDSGLYDWERPTITLVTIAKMGSTAN